MTEDEIEEAMIKMWEKENNEVMIVDSEKYKIVKKLAKEYKTWMVDLFSPAGLKMLFPTLKGK